MTVVDRPTPSGDGSEPSDVVLADVPFRRAPDVATSRSVGTGSAVGRGWSVAVTRVASVLVVAGIALAGCDSGGGSDRVGNGNGNGNSSGDVDGNGADGGGDAVVTDTSTVIERTRADDWYVDGAARVREGSAASVEKGAARNVILFVGDGMSLTTETAARILEGQRAGGTGEEHVLSFEALPYAGLAKTYNVDAQTPDSAGTMTAMMSGVKTDAGLVGVDERVERGDCGSVRGRELVTALELAELAGMASGIVTTARLTHATPAATYAKSADRNWEDDSDMPEPAIAAGCTDIASQFVAFESALEARYPGSDVDGIEVAMGGGRRHFLPNVASANSGDAESEIEGDRTDGRNLVDEWRATNPTGTYVFDRAGFDALDADNDTPVLALFDESHLHYEADRANDIAGEPPLSAMTASAIDLLDGDPDGFFLMVESGRIDHAHHAGSARGALTDTIELAAAVARAREMTDESETLILVTADHGHVFTMGGSPRRGNPILGPVVRIGATEIARAADGWPYTTLGYANGRGFHDFGSVTNADASYTEAPVGGRVDLRGVDTNAPGFHQEALVPLTAETHSGEDVAVHASGPGSPLISGTHEQSALFHVMNHAADLVGRADAALAGPP